MGRARPSPEKRKARKPSAPARGERAPALIAPGWHRDPALWAATLFFAAVALGTLTKNGLWNDEWYHQFNFAHPAPHQGLAHRLHYLIARPWAAAFGVEPFALRLPWALFGVACVPLAYLLGLVAGERPLARLMALLAASSSYLLFYSQDASYYAEMIFYTLGAAAGYAHFVQSASFFAATVGAACSICLYLVHPFGAVGGGALTLAAAIGAAASPAARGRLLRELIPRPMTPAAAGLRFAPVAILAFLGWRYHVFARLMADGGRFFEAFSPGGTYSNLAFNLRFVNALLMQFGPSLVFESRAVLWLGWLFLAIAAFGAGDLWRRRWTLLLFPALAFGAAAFVMFCFEIDRFFHFRYISFVVPLYWLLLASGLRLAGERLAARWPARPAVFYAPACALLAALAPFWLGQVFFDGGYVKKAEEYLRVRIGPEDRIVTFPSIWPQPSGAVKTIPEKQVIKMPGNVEAGQGWLNDAFAKQMFFRFPASWLLHTWQAPGKNHPPLLEWADARMTRALTAPSIFDAVRIREFNRPDEADAPRVYEAILHRWDWPDRYLIGAPLELDLAREDELPRWELKEERGLAKLSRDAQTNGIRWESPFLAEHGGPYRIALRTTAGDAPETSATLAINGTRIEPAAPGVYRAELRAGENAIALELAQRDGAAEGQETPRRRLPKLSINPDWTTGARLHPFYLDPPGPEDVWVKGETRGGRPALVFQRNDAAAFRARIDEGGRYCIEVDAVEDRPGAVIADLLVDGAPSGIFRFERADDSWGRRRALLDLQPGDRRFTLNFLSEREAEADPEKNNDFILGGITLRAAKPDDKDDRLTLEGAAVKASALAPNFVEFSRAGRVPENWGATGEFKLDARADKGAVSSSGETGSILRIELDSGAGAAQLITPPLPAGGARYIYFDCEARSLREGKHSANIVIEYSGEGGEPLKHEWGRGADINAFSDWIRYAYLGEIPPGTRQIVLGFMFYQNSRVAFQPTSQFEFRRLRVIDR